MQVNRSNSIQLVFPPVSPQANGAAPVAAPATAPLKPAPAAPAQDSGVIYTASAPVLVDVLLEPPTAEPTPPTAIAAAPAEPAPSKTGDANFENLSLQNQLELGRSSGVFTKITLSKDGVLVLKPTGAAKAADFATAAAATMKDFEEGIALMKKNAGEHHDKPHPSLSGKLKELTAKLHVFA